MARNNSRKRRRAVDPIFPIPKGAEDEIVHTSTEPRIIRPDMAVGLGDVRPQQVNPEGSEVYYLQPPESFVVFDQKIRRAPGGQQVVDIVLSVEDSPGASEYEVQIAKV